MSARNLNEKVITPGEIVTISSSKQDRVIKDYTGIPSGVVSTNCQLLWGQDNYASGVKVGVIDTGVDLHPDIAHRIKYRKSFAGNVVDGHGTHVVGTICGYRSETQGIVGIARGVDIYDIQVMGDGSGSVDDVIKGIELAVELELDIINLSLGVEEYNSKLHSVIKKAHATGMIIVAAAGNNGHNSSLYPGSFNECISVGNFDLTRERINPSSSTNNEVDFCAPGTEILSCYLRGEYIFYTGTSMAAPHVTGLASLYLSNLRRDYPGVSKVEMRKRVIDLMKVNTIDRGIKGRDNVYGIGQVKYRPYIGNEYIGNKASTMSNKNLDRRDGCTVC